MIETFFRLDALSMASAFFAAFIIGICFGFALERAGFGSSRRLAGIFYFRDMTVLKVMFTGVVAAMLGLCYCAAFGLIKIDSHNIFLMSTIYIAQIVSGLVFGVGFVIGGWCPGTAAVGLASGKMDALLFLLGAVVGSVIFNEVFPLLKALYTMGESGVVFVYDSLRMPRPAFALLFTIIAVGCFWLAEYVEKKRSGTGTYLNTPFLRFFSLALVLAAAGLFILPDAPDVQERQLMDTVAQGDDHIEPEELAERIVAGDTNLLVIDTRPAEEFRHFHLRNAVNITIPELAEFLAPYRLGKTIVLYSNGMTHPAQARDSLSRLGYRNVFLLTDGLEGFIARCLKPASLRSEPVPQNMRLKIQAWRAFFLNPTAPLVTPSQVTPTTLQTHGERLVETSWLGENLAREDVKILDVRDQPAYNTNHIPGAMFVSVESFRGIVNSVPSMLLPAPMLAAQLSLMGIRPTDTVILVPDDKIHNATLVIMALERLGHAKYAILTGGHNKWVAERRTVDTVLPPVRLSQYPVEQSHDQFTVDYKFVAEAMRQRQLIIDVRPQDYFSGEKTEEARGGHIPGAINRPFTQDIRDAGTYKSLKPTEELEKVYAGIIPNKNTQVIVHCRTGHQASQTFFVLKSLLGYRQVLWYDGGWTEWATHDELPVVRGNQ